MGQNQLTQDQPAARKTVAILLTGVSWVISALLVLMCIFAIREIALFLMATIFTVPDPAQNAKTDNLIDTAHQCLMPFLGIIALVVTIFSSEYVFRYAGQPRSFRALIRIIAVECAIVLPVWWLFWRP